MMYELLFTKQAQKDWQKLKQSNLDKNAKSLIELIRIAPFSYPLGYETLVGDLKGAYSRRINIQRRLVYSADQDKMIVRVLRMWTHYE